MRGLIRLINENSTLSAKPFLYVGGKFLLRHIIREKILSLRPSPRVYVEPFCGSAAVFFSLPRFDVEVLNDIDVRLIHFFRTMQDVDTARQLAALVELSIMDSRLNGIAHDLMVGRDFASVMRAWAFIYLQNTSFRGSLRETPVFVDHNVLPKRARYIERFSERLRGVHILNRDAIDVIREYDSSETVFFLDPPYPQTANEYAIRDEDVDVVNRRLAEVLPTLKGKFVLTCYANRLYDELNFVRFPINVRQCFNPSKRVVEVIYSNF